MAGLVIQVSGSLVEVDILEQSMFPCPETGLGRMTAIELDLNLTLGIAERIKTESPPDEESWGRGQGFDLGQTQSHPLLESGCFLSNR